MLSPPPRCWSVALRTRTHLSSLFPLSVTLSLSALRAPHRIPNRSADTSAPPFTAQPCRLPLSLSVRSSPHHIWHTHWRQSIRAMERVRTAPRSNPHPAPRFPLVPPRAKCCRRPPPRRLSFPTVAVLAAGYSFLSLFFAQRPSPPPFVIALTEPCATRERKGLRAHLLPLSLCVLLCRVLLLLRHLIV